MQLGRWQFVRRGHFAGGMVGAGCTWLVAGALGGVWAAFVTGAILATLGLVLEEYLFHKAVKLDGPSIRAGHIEEPPSW